MSELLVEEAPPAMLDDYRRHASLAEHLEEAGDGYVFVAVNEGGEWPQLVVTQRFRPDFPGGVMDAIRTFDLTAGPSRST